MPLWVFVIVIVAVVVVSWLILRPLRVLTRRQMLISHGFIISGLALISGWLWMKTGDAMLIGGIWTVLGGI